MPHLVMFDIDGTLTLSNEVDARCYVRAMEENPATFMAGLVFS